MTQFRRKTQIIEAVQFSRVTRGEVLMLVGPDNFREETYGPQKRYYILRSDGEWSALFTGQWVARQGNSIWTYTVDNFDLMFEPIEESITA